MIGLEHDKVITSQKELQKLIQLGMKQLSDIVGKTLGPGGLPILLERSGLDAAHRPLKPLVTKDGVTVARSIKVKDNRLNTIISSVIEVAEKTNIEAGDGTTTAIVLANALYQEGLRYIAIDQRPEQVYKEVFEVIKFVLSQLDYLAIKDRTLDFIRSVASISANNDMEIGEVIGKAFEEVGEEGVITLEEGYGSSTGVRVEHGFQVDRGLMSPDVFFTNPGRGECSLQNAAVILYNGELSDEGDIIPVLKKVTSDFTERNSFVLICKDIVGAALNTLVVNRMEQRITNFCMLRAPHVGHVSSQIMEDIAVATGGKLLQPDQNNQASNLRNCTLEDLGFAKKIVSSKYRTLLYEGGGEKADIMERIEMLKELKKRAESPYDGQIIEARMACLSGGIAIIEVGGKTELEMKEKKDRIEDALNATRAAIQEGIIPGGGSVLYFISSMLGKSPVDEVKSLPEIGKKIVATVLQSPLRQILKNLGESPDVQLSEISKLQLKKGPSWGYNGISRQVSNLIEDKVIDPVKVVKCALMNAVSIANLLLTCGGSVTIDSGSKSPEIDMAKELMSLQQEMNE